MKFDYEDEINIDLTPLIDVVFMLLIFFIMTMTFTTPFIEVVLPTAETADVATENRQELIIAVNSAGEIYYGKDMLTTEQLTTLMNTHSSHLLNLHVDEKAPFSSFVEIIEIAKTEHEGGFIITTNNK